MSVHKKFKLNDQDRIICEALIKKRNIPVWEYKRYMILLLLDQDKTYKEIELKLDTQNRVISTWKKRYIKNGISGLKDLPRSGAPRKITAETEAEVLSVTQLPTPPGKTHWTNVAIGKKVNLHPRRIGEILNRNNLKPHLLKSFMVSNDPDFEKKASDIIGLYMNPPENAVVLCVDEKTAIQALDRTQPNLPMKPHHIERQTFEYKRNGVTSLYAAFNTKTGDVTGACHPKHTQNEFILFLNKLDKKYGMDKNKEIHVIIDNFAAHKTERVKEWLRNHPNWNFHFTPTYSSWINQVECWFSIISRQCIRRGVFQDVKSLISEIQLFIKEYNKNAKPFRWTYDNPSRRIAI
jgi:transposase